MNTQLKERMMKARNEMVVQAKDYEYPQDDILEGNFFFALGVMDAALDAAHALKVDACYEKALAFLLAWNYDAAHAYIEGRGMEEEAGWKLIRDATELTDAEASGMTVSEYRELSANEMER